MVLVESQCCPLHAKASAADTITTSCPTLLLQQDVLHHGEKKRLGGVLRREMEQLLPPDAHQLCSSGPRVNASSSSAAHCHIIPPTSAEPQQQASSSAIAQRASSTAQHNSAVANTAAPDLNQQPPCVLGATRVTCPSCLQPDVFVGECQHVFCTWTPAKLQQQLERQHQSLALEAG